MRNILIFGDSYSTFKKHIPNGYDTYYPQLDVHLAEQTWWMKASAKINGNLIQNNSWSGSTIGYTGYNDSDCSKSSSFIYRYRKLKEEAFFEQNTIDTVFVFGGTNDSWSEAPLGEMKLSNWVEKDLFQALPAICHFVCTLKENLPNAEIVVIINTEIKEQIQDALENIAKFCEIKYVRLRDIDKECGHPTAKGMAQISEQVLSVLK